MNLGKLSEARAMTADISRRFPSATTRASMLFVDALADELVGQFAASDARLDSIVRMPNASNQPLALGALVSNAAIEGRITRMASTLAAAAAATPAAGRRAPLVDSVMLALVDVTAADQPARAMRRVDAALAATPFARLPIANRPYFDVATIYARAGRADRAKAVIAQRASEIARDTARLRDEQPYVHRVLGEIAIAEGRPRDAVKEFWKGDSLPDGPVDECDACTYVNLARAYDKANAPDSAIVYFEKFFASTDSYRFQADYTTRGPALRRLGELYEAKGDRAKAAHYYQEFVNLWKNADPELQPQVAEIKRRLARLDKSAG